MTTPLVPCPFCGCADGYTIADGPTYRWWNVLCNACGRLIGECHSDRRAQLGTVLPERWPDADLEWNEAGAHAQSLRLSNEHIAAELAAATRALVAWDCTVLPKANDGMMQERMEDLRAALIPLANAASPAERETLTDEDCERAQRALIGPNVALTPPHSVGGSTQGLGV